MQQWTKQIGIFVLFAAIAPSSLSADEPSSGPIRRFFQRNECERCDQEIKMGAAERARMERQYGPPVTVRYPVAVPSHEIVKPTPNAIRRPWNRRGYLCWAHRDSAASPSVRSTLLFMFGSSRAFFGEPCIPEPSMLERHQMRSH